MSTSILNPIMFSDYHSKQFAPRRNLCNNKVDRIKRDLFGPPNPLDIKIFEDELHKQQEIACKKWSFDFRNGKPINDQSNFIWERVPFADLVPTMYTLTRAAHCRHIDNSSPASSLLDLLMDERANRENETSHIDEIVDDIDSIFKMPINGEHLMISSCKKLATNERQPKITEYMNKRKRLSSTSKKLSPPKRLRSSTSNITASKHFPLFSPTTRRNNNH